MNDRYRIQMMKDLRAVRALLLFNDTSWTKCCLARDAAGSPCFSFDLSARCWCLRGAIEAVLERSGRSKFGRYREDLERVVDRAVKRTTRFCDYVVFNDDPHTTRKDVIALIDNTINFLRPARPVRATA